MMYSDCIVIEGSNMAECHPVAFRWPMKAKVEHGAKLIHVDPRFTRTSAMCDLYAPIRAGSDIALLGGLVNYGNGATISREDFKDAEDLDGVFSGLMEYSGNTKNWTYDGFVGQYQTDT